MKKSLLVIVPCLALVTLAFLVWVAMTLNANAPAITGGDLIAASPSTNTKNETDWPMVNYDYTMFLQSCRW